MKTYARYRGNPKAEETARLNDYARKAMGLECRLIQTMGINALPSEDQSAIREKVETFKDFNQDNDPWGEHDFGKIEYKGRKIFWKMDYFQRGTGYMYGSTDPSDYSVTSRVLTIMLAEEY